MKTAFLAFTDKGLALAKRLASQLGGSAERCGGEITLTSWTHQHFKQGNALVFVGAAGIAVRAIAPYCRSKALDPAVVVVDECAHFAVPLLSGHLGGANNLARKIASVCGAVSVITTATDANGVFAVDEWAKQQGCAVAEIERIKHVSGKLLAGESIKMQSNWAVQGTAPNGVVLASAGDEPDFCLTVHSDDTQALHIVPHIGVLGVGCRRGVAVQQLEEAFAAFIKNHRLFAQCITCAASIDLKQDEAGLLEFCANHGWDVSFYSAEQLKSVQGQFTPSNFVQNVTGVDNVCERAAVLKSKGELAVRKQAGGGVTFALALMPFLPKWSDDE